MACSSRGASCGGHGRYAGPLENCAKGYTLRESQRVLREACVTYSWCCAMLARSYHTLREHSRMQHNVARHLRDTNITLYNLCATKEIYLCDHYGPENLLCTTNYRNADFEYPWKQIHFEPQTNLVKMWNQQGLNPQPCDPESNTLPPTLY